MQGCRQETLQVHAASLKKVSQTQFNWSFRFFAFVFAKCVFLLVCIFNNGFIEIQFLYHIIYLFEVYKSMIVGVLHY